MPPPAQNTRPSSHSGGPSRWGITLALLFAEVVILAPKPGWTDSLAPEAAAESRIAAAEATEPAKAAPDDATVDPRRDSGGATGEPPPRGLDGRARYRALIEKETAHVSLSPEIAEAVMAVESGYDPGAVGSSGEIGLMQVLPSTARMLGFTGAPTDLAAPEINIHYGVTYLAQAWRLAGGDLCTAVMKYRAGHGETRFSTLSVDYCLAVRAKLAARGYPVTGAVPVATFGGAPGSSSGLSSRLLLSCRRNCLTALAGGRLDIDGINNNLSQLVLQANVHTVRLR
jgi:soluble lytic murein transglycosylase-like protein